MLRIGSANEGYTGSIQAGMFRRYILATMLLLGSSMGGLPVSRQDAGQGSNSRAQTPDASTAPSGAAPKPQENPTVNQKDAAQPARAKKNSNKNSLTKPGSPSAADPAPHKVVIHKGSTGEPPGLLAPGMSEEQASHQRQNAEQLLQSTEGNLHKLEGRALSASQQDAVLQVRDYMGKARSALERGDPKTARNLSFKAHLLSDDLVKRQ